MAMQRLNEASPYAWEEAVQYFLLVPIRNLFRDETVSQKHWYFARNSNQPLGTIIFHGPYLNTESNVKQYKLVKRRMNDKLDSCEVSSQSERSGGQLCFRGEGVHRRGIVVTSPAVGLVALISNALHTVYSHEPYVSVSISGAGAPYVRNTCSGSRD